MRQTRRSRSAAATPQKDDAPNQEEEVKVDEKSVKTNLETVFEKEADQKDGAAAEQENTDEVEAADDVVPSEEKEMSTEDTALALELPTAEPMESKPPAAKPVASEPPASDEAAETEKSDDLTKAEASPKKPDSGVIELNCQVCNCSFTNYHEHMHSESHKSKISHSAVKTDTPDKTNPAGQALKRSGEPDGAPSPKRMKNVTAPTTDKFYCDVCKLTILKQQDFDHHMNGKRHLLNVTRAQGKSYCDICKLFFNSLTDLNDHNESQMHKKNVADRKQDKQVFECKLCAVTSCGQRQYDQHLTSKRHKRLLENPTGPNTTAVNGKVETKNEFEKKWLYLCNACNFGSNQDQQFSSHMNLAEHKAAVTDMKKKGLVREKDGGKPAASKPAVTNTSQNVRKFPPTHAGPRTSGATSGAMNKPVPKPNVISNAAGALTSVTYNIVAGPNAGMGALSKQGPIKKDGPQPLRKGPPPAASGPSGLKKNMPPNKPMQAVNKPPLSGRPNPRFQGKPIDNAPNKFVSNPQPMKLGFQNAGNNFGPAFGAPSHEPNIAGGNFGSYRSGNFGGNMRNDVNPGPDMRNDFRNSMRDDYRADVRDIRDIRDVRPADMSVDNRGDSSFRAGAGFYRDMSGDSGRDARGDFGGNYRGGEMSVDTRSDARPGLAADIRGDMRGGMARNDMSRDVAVADLRGYSNNDMRDVRNESRGDYVRDRSTMSGYGGSAAFVQTYRGNDDYRSDNYGRSTLPAASTTSAGNYSSGMMASGRYDNYADRNTSAYNQYSGSSRGMGYMGDMSLNGR